MVVRRIFKKDCRVPSVSDDLTFQRRCRMTDCRDEMSSDATRARCRQMSVVRCHRVPDAARYQLPDAPPPGPGGGLGEVSRAPVLMSSALISGDALPPSVLGSHWLRRWATCSRRQVWGPTPLDVSCPTVLFRAFLSPTRPPDIHHLRSFGRRPLLSPPAAPRSQTSTAANRRFRPWRPAAAADSLFPAPSAHGGGRRTRRFRRAACWLWLPSCRSFEVL